MAVPTVWSKILLRVQGSTALLRIQIIALLGVEIQHWTHMEHTPKFATMEIHLVATDAAAAAKLKTRILARAPEVLQLLLMSVLIGVATLHSTTLELTRNCVMMATSLMAMDAVLHAKLRLDIPAQEQATKHRIQTCATDA